MDFRDHEAQHERRHKQAPVPTTKKYRDGEPATQGLIFCPKACATPRPSTAIRVQAIRVQTSANVEAARQWPAGEESAAAVFRRRLPHQPFFFDGCRQDDIRGMGVVYGGTHDGV